MAKTSGSNSDLKSLLTTAERKLLDGTLGESLTAATKEQLAALRKQTRALRDKWHDLFKRQTIASKRKPVANDQANARSREKSDIFGDAVKRVEARIAALAEVLAASVTPDPKKATAIPRKSAVVKAQPAKAPGSKTVLAPRQKKASPKPTTSKKARQAGKRKSLATEGTGQPIAFDVKKQRAAKARATVARLKIDGEATRRKGFTVSNTKRKQARRDGR